MNRAVICVLAVGLWVFAPAFAGGEIYGTITTRRGQTYTGPIRWDRNENFWNDELNATKTERIKNEDNGASFSLFGIKFGGGDDYIRHGFSIPFGHLSRIEPMGGDDAMLTLKTGESLRVDGGHSSDIGRGLRGLEIEDAEEGTVKLDWSSIDEVEFRADPGRGTDDQRLYGTVVTSDGAFTGYIVWDRDESMLEDIIDGEDEDGRDREIPLREIQAIEPRSRGGSTLTLTGDKTIVLRDTNDIDDGHRGILVTLDGVGIVDIDWDDVGRVDFAKAPPSPGYATFDGGRPLSGTVHTSRGALHKGTIVWDRDESYTWETLDGELDRFDYSIPFVNIASVERNGSRASRVTLRSGDVFVLTGSNDVNSDHKGIVVTTEGNDTVELDWMEVDRVEFD